MNEIILIKPTIKYYNQLCSFRETLVSDSDFIGTCELKKFPLITEWLTFIHRQEKPETCRKLFVPETVYMLYDKKRDVVLGMSSLRHFLNENYELTGGHIGYTISPLFRNNGYGTLILNETLKKCTLFKIEEALIIINKDNEYSRKIILNNNGEFKDEIPFHENIFERYTIRIK